MQTTFCTTVLLTHRYQHIIYDQSVIIDDDPTCEIQVYYVRWTFESNCSNKNTKKDMRPLFGNLFGETCSPGIRAGFTSDPLLGCRTLNASREGLELVTSGFWGRPWSPVVAVVAARAVKTTLDLPPAATLSDIQSPSDRLFTAKRTNRRRSSSWMRVWRERSERVISKQGCCCQDALIATVYREVFLHVRPRRINYSVVSQAFCLITMFDKKQADSKERRGGTSGCDLGI